MSQVRRLLMIAYTFPPVTGVGIERSLKHTTYLPDAGWRPVVVAPANPGYRLVDPATLERIPPGIEVRRAMSLEPAHLRRAAGRILRRGAPPRGVGSPGAPDSARGGTRALVNDVWRTYVGLAFFPDEQIGWAPGAIAAGWSAHAVEPVDAIYSSGPPWTCHVVGAVLKRLTGRPWVADFRDPWIGNAYATRLPAPHRAARAALERLVVEGADASVFASAGVRDRYADRYPDLEDRFTTLPNGYDLDDIAIAIAGRAGRPEADGPFRLIFTGSLQYVPEFKLLADGVATLLARRPDLRNRLRVQLVGWIGPEVQALAAARLPSLEPVVERLGFQPRARTLELLGAAEAALVVLAPGPGRADVPSAKLFDYLGLDRPVLAVAPPGEVRRILAELDWGVAVDPSPGAFADGVERLMAMPAPNRPADAERRFERRTLSRRLADLLDGLVHDPR